MKVILLEKVYNLGNLGDVVQVKAGYARNFLIPQHKAISATKENLAVFESKRAELEKKANEQLTMAQERAKAFENLGQLVIVAKALEEGKLFGSVNVREITEALAAKGIEVERKEINMPLGPIHEIGEHDVEVMLHSDVVLTLKVKVEAEV